LDGSSSNLDFSLFASSILSGSEGVLIAMEKDRLLQEFQILADNLQQQAAQQGIRLESICPKNGTPRYSRAGNLHFDIVAAFHACLGFDFVRTEVVVSQGRTDG